MYKAIHNNNNNNRFNPILSLQLFRPWLLPQHTTQTTNTDKLHDLLGDDVTCVTAITATAAVTAVLIHMILIDSFHTVGNHGDLVGVRRADFRRNVLTDEELVETGTDDSADNRHERGHQPPGRSGFAARG